MLDDFLENSWNWKGAPGSEPFGVKKGFDLYYFGSLGNGNGELEAEYALSKVTVKTAWTNWETRLKRMWDQVSNIEVVFFKWVKKVGPIWNLKGQTLDTKYASLLVKIDFLFTESMLRIQIQVSPSVSVLLSSFCVCVAPYHLLTHIPAAWIHSCLKCYKQSKNSNFPFIFTLPTPALTLLKQCVPNLWFDPPDIPSEW